jgi:hypothetical protein
MGSESAKVNESATVPPQAGRGGGGWTTVKRKLTSATGATGGDPGANSRLNAIPGGIHFAIPLGSRPTVTVAGVVPVRGETMTKLSTPPLNWRRVPRYVNGTLAPVAEVIWRAGGSSAESAVALKFKDAGVITSVCPWAGALRVSTIPTALAQVRRELSSIYLPPPCAAKSTANCPDPTAGTLTDDGACGRMVKRTPAFQPFISFTLRIRTAVWPDKTETPVVGPAAGQFTENSRG